MGSATAGARRQKPRKSSLRRRRSTRSARRNGTPRSRSGPCRPTLESCARTSSTRGWRRCRRSAARTRRRTPGRRRRPRRASSRICGASTTRTRRRRRRPGEPGKEGGFLADALAPPGGFTLENAIVCSGEHLDGAFAHAMLQRCSCADGAGGSRSALVRNDVPSYVTVHWEGADRHAGPGDPPEKEWRSESTGWLAAKAKPAYHTRRGRPFESCRQVDLKHAEKVRKKRAKPALGAQFGLLADATIGMGQAHSKFWLLRFKPAAAGRSGGVVRLVISSGNCRPVAYAAHPKRELVGLWFADFKEVDGRPRRRRRRRRTAAALSGARERAVGAGAGGLREDGRDARRRARAVRGLRGLRAHGLLAGRRRGRAPRCPRAGVASERRGGRSRGAAGGVRRGMRRGRRRAPELFRRVPQLRRVARGGRDGAGAALAPQVGHGARWRRHQRVLARARRQATLPERPVDRERWIEICDAGPRPGADQGGVRGRSPDAPARGRPRERAGADKYVYTPHLMLYVLHDAAGGIKRLLLSSANLSAAAWGAARPQVSERRERAADRRGGALEVRSFRLGVSGRPPTRTERRRTRWCFPRRPPASARGVHRRQLVGPGRPA